jgi:hypothetical protein
MPDMIRPGCRHDSVRAADILRRRCPVSLFEHPTHGRGRQVQPRPGKYLRNLHLPQRRTQCLEPHDHVPHKVRKPIRRPTQLDQRFRRILIHAGTQSAIAPVREARLVSSLVCGSAQVVFTPLPREFVDSPNDD